MTDTPKKKIEYGLIGEHLSHSFSKEIHESFAGYKYELCELSREELPAFLKNRDFKGINVTIPYKEEVIQYLDELSEEARKTGAVNTIVNRDGRLYGYNTDYFGLVELIKKTGISLNDKNVMILGTGGTSRTAEAVARDLGAKNVVKVSRFNDNYQNSVEIEKVVKNASFSETFPDNNVVKVSRFDDNHQNDNENDGNSHTFPINKECSINTGKFSNILEENSGFPSKETKEATAIISYEAAVQESDTEVIINTTPCGMYPHLKESPIPLDGFTKLCGVIDVIYNPLNTKLIQDVAERNIPSANGLFMLAAQAVKASELFTCNDMEDSDESAAESVTDSFTEHAPSALSASSALSFYSFSTVSSVYDMILKKKQNIVLTGMPGSGKSTLGSLLAGETGRRFIDTDREIIERTGRTPADIIQKDGEKTFRDIESEMISEILGVQGAVIATGGGSILSDDNVKALRQNGKLVFIDKAINELKISKNRPLSNNREQLQKLYNERIDIYKNAADETVKLHGSITECVEMLRGAIEI